MSSLTQTAAPAPEPSRKGLSDAEKARLIGCITMSVTNLQRLASHEINVQGALVDTQTQRRQEVRDIRTWAKRIAPAVTIEQTYSAILSQFNLSSDARDYLWLALYDYGE